MNEYNNTIKYALQSICLCLLSNDQKENTRLEYNSQNINQLCYNNVIKCIIDIVHQVIQNTHKNLTHKVIMTRSIQFSNKDYTTLPSVSFNDLVYHRLIKYLHPPIIDLICVLIIIDHIILRGNIIISEYTIHRLFSVTLMVLIKFNEDFYDTNTLYSRLIGIPTHEFNYLEIQILQQSDFSLWIQSAEIDDYCKYIGLICK